MLTRDRVVAEALTVISVDGVEALTMRALATRPGVVPGALYRRVRSEDQLHGLVLDGVLRVPRQDSNLRSRSGDRSPTSPPVS